MLEVPRGEFGQDGAYDGLRTDHELRLRKTPAVRLHYQLERAS